MTQIEICKIKPSPYQPRTVFEVEELKESIKDNGQLMPLVVREVKDYIELIDGDRRLHALKLLGLKFADCSIIVASDALARKMVWKINIDRADYSVEEKARFLKKLSDSGMKINDISKELNEDYQWILANINLFKLSIDIQQAVWTNRLTMSHIKELEPIIGAGQILVAEKTLHEAMDRKLTAKETRVGAKDIIDEIENQRMEAAKQAISQIPKVAGGTMRFSVPEDYENAAKLLKNKAKEERLSKLTEEDKIKIEDEKTLKQKEKNQKHKEVVEKIKAEVIAEAKAEAKAELLEDEEFIKSIVPQQTVQLPQIEFSQFPEMSDEMKTEIRERGEKLEADLKAKANPEQAKLYANWLAHIQILNVLKSLSCPQCGKNYENLKWSCCNLTAEEAYKILQKKMES